MFVALDDKLNPICGVTEDAQGQRHAEPITFTDQKQALTWIKEHHNLIKDAQYRIVPLNIYLESVKQRDIRKRD